MAGTDVALDLQRGRAIAGVIVYRFPEMEEIERVWAERRLTFPYVPGLLSFREIPVLLKALARLRHAPDVIFCDGQGYAHPRRFGIACHLGVLLDCPTIGCAKSILVGTAEEPGQKAGAWTPLVDGGEVVGAVLRTREAREAGLYFAGAPHLAGTGHRTGARGERWLPHPQADARGGSFCRGGEARRVESSGGGEHGQIKTGGKRQRRPPPGVGGVCCQTSSRNFGIPAPGCAGKPAFRRCHVCNTVIIRREEMSI